MLIFLFEMRRDNELVLVDAGAEYQCYATDITRTWPINGKFTKAQLDVYNAVLDIQQKFVVVFLRYTPYEFISLFLFELLNLYLDVNVQYFS
jgi:hypothetical protein